MTIKTQARAPGSFILTEANGARSRENLSIPAGIEIKVGHVLGVEKANVGAVTVGSPAFTGTGNGVLINATPAYGAGVQEGSYTAHLIEAGANSGQWEVRRADGTIDGYATVGTAYDGQWKFTITDGSTDFSGAAQFAVAVAIADPAAVGSYKPLDLAATDGTQNAGAIAIYPLASDAPYRKIAGMVRDMEAIGGELEWPSGIDANGKAAAIAQLAAQGIIVR